MIYFTNISWQLIKISFALCQAAESYRVALQCGELIQIARFYPQMVEFAQMYLNKF